MSDMSDQKELSQAHDLIKEVLTGLKDTIVQPHSGDNKGGLFPDGVNDIYLNASIGPVKIELEITAADHVSSKLPGVDRTTDDADEIALKAPCIGRATGDIENHVHPMVLWNPTNTDAYFTLSHTAKPEDKKPPVGASTVEEVPIEGSNDKIICANMHPKHDMYVYVTRDKSGGRDLLSGDLRHIEAEPPK
jgi:hypothetical protein